jgi:hypothetical protein
MGDEVQMLKFLQDLLCHEGFQHTCVTAAPYNATDFPWKLVKAHIMGAWENNNHSLYLQGLRQQILAMQLAHDQVAALADIAKTSLGELQGFNPFNTLNYSFWSFIGIVLLMTCCFCLLSVRTQTIKR